MLKTIPRGEKCNQKLREACLKEETSFLSLWVRIEHHQDFFCKGLRPRHDMNICKYRFILRKTHTSWAAMGTYFHTRLSLVLTWSTTAQRKNGEPINLYGEVFSPHFLFICSYSTEESTAFMAPENGNWTFSARLETNSRGQPFFLRCDFDVKL